MAEPKKINKIPTTLTRGTGKKKEVFTHFISQKSMKDAKATKDQIKDHFKKVHIETNIFEKEKLYSVFIIRNED